MTQTSFLARLARPQRRARRSERVWYDDASDMLMVRRNGRWVPGIDASESPATKKADIEKGEDQKDRWQ